VREVLVCRRLLIAAFLLLTLLILVGGLSRSAYADSAGSEPPARVTSVRSTGPDEVAARLVVPHLLSGNLSASNAFTATVAGQSLPLTARPLGTADLQLAVAIDTGVPAGALATEQGVVREFLLRLPRPAVVSLIDAQSGLLLGAAEPPDRAVSLLARLQPILRRAQSADRWLIPALSHLLPQPRWQSIVYIGGGGPTGPASDTALRQLRSVPIAVNELLLYEVPTNDLSATTGGRLVQAGNDQELLAGADSIADDLASTSELLIHTSAPAGSQVTITAPGMGRTEFAIPSHSLTAQPTPPREGGQDHPASRVNRRPRVLVGLLAGLGLVLIGSGLGLGRSRNKI